MTNLQKNYLSPATTTCLKGLMALIIVAGHIRNNLIWLNDTLIGQLLTASGYLCVAVFFFFSGYGLLFQYKKRGEEYVNGFLKNRLLDFYVKYLVIILVYFVTKAIFSSVATVFTLLSSLAFGDTIIENGWYLQAILILYILFWLVIRFLPRKGHWYAAGFALCFITYCALCLAFGRVHWWWYQSVLGFFFGLFVAWNKETIDTLLAKKHTDLWLLILSFAAFCVTFLLGHWTALPSMMRLVGKMLSAPLFAAMTVLLLRFVKIENRLTKWLGAISFELYAMHGLFVHYLRREPLYVNDTVYIAAVYICSFLSAMVLNVIFKTISKQLKKGN